MILANHAPQTATSGRHFDLSVQRRPVTRPTSGAPAAPPGCAFCRKNGESEMWYLSHQLKDHNNRISCPILKKFKCPLCQVVGQHTVRYCPLNANRDAHDSAKHLDFAADNSQHRPWAPPSQQAAKANRRQAANSKDPANRKSAKNPPNNKGSFNGEQRQRAASLNSSLNSSMNSKLTLDSSADISSSASTYQESPSLSAAYQELDAHNVARLDLGQLDPDRYRELVKQVAFIVELLMLREIGPKPEKMLIFI